MRFFTRREPQPEDGPIVIINGATEQAGDDPAVSHRAEPAQFKPDGGDHQTCPECRGTGRKLTTRDYLAEVLALFPTDGRGRLDLAKMDQFVVAFYTRLLADDQQRPLGQQLLPLFPPDLLDHGSPAKNSHGSPQREMLLTALVGLFEDYDPDLPDSPAMRRLNTGLEVAGRRHGAFRRPDGTVQGATIDEYRAVGGVLLGLLADTFGPKWLPEYTIACGAAYDHAMIEMLHAAQRAGMQAPRYPRAAR